MNDNTSTGGVPLEAIQRLQRQANGAEQPFTSNLSSDAFTLLARMRMRPIGLVMGSCVYTVGTQMVPDPFHNSHLHSLTFALNAARERAIARLETEARALNAHGVVAISLRVKNTFSEEINAIEVTALGTSIAVPGGEEHLRASSGKPFTSSLSVQDFYLLYNMGYMPSMLVAGNCVFHFGLLSDGERMAYSAFNAEMEARTQGLYAAREFVMSEMWAQAWHNQADGIVDIRFSQNTFQGWPPNVIEFSALGTSIVRRTDVTFPIDLPAPVLIRSIDDTGTASVSM